MRIIAGIAKSRRLKSVRGQQVRPTSDRVKESVFSILGETVINARILDIFAGTGNLGLEALSRGAQFAVFIDNDSRSIKVIQENIVALGFESTTQVIKGEVLTVLDKIEKSEVRSQKSEKTAFDLVFLDPPYLKELEVPTIAALIESNLLNEKAIVVVEHHKKTEMPEIIRNITRFRQQKYGDTIITFYQKT
ncbi:MAG: 16S rRNA (guanine(966)-N(2))-methyltransferase RsmD [bacterium]